MQGGLVTTVSDLHHEHHTARPELYIPKVIFAHLVWDSAAAPAALASGGR